MRPFSALLFLFAIGTTGCAGATQQQLVKRASFDLNCPEKKLEVVTIDGRTKGVRGCERRATYVESCETGINGNIAYRTNCTWVLNADAK